MGNGDWELGRVALVLLAFFALLIYLLLSADPVQSKGVSWLTCLIGCL